MMRKYLMFVGSGMEMYDNVHDFILAKAVPFNNWTFVNLH